MKFGVLGADSVRDRSLWRRLELPTWGVAIAVYGGWAWATWHHERVPLWLLFPLGGWLIAWHGSLQHEAVHGHPTRWPIVNAAIAGAPLWLWLPYSLYRESHLAHHATDELTDPFEDPESYYVTSASWHEMHGALRALLRAQSTLLGRLLLGPFVIAVRLFLGEWRRIRGGQRRRLFVWLVHMLLCALVLGWVIGVCGMPAWKYVACFVYPGLALTLLRSFIEHRPAETQARRSAIVEAGPILSLLFLNNNLHALHHRSPAIPWYDLPARYRRLRDVLLADNGGYAYAGYAEVARRYGLRTKDDAIHSPTLATRSAA